MGNQIYIIPTTFVDAEGDEKFGVRVCDEAQTTYTDLWEEIPAEDMNILRKVLEDDNSQINEIVHLAVENQSNVHIGENFYKWEEVEAIFDEILELD